MGAVGRPSMGSSAAPMIEEKRRGRVKNGSRSSNANPRYRKRERDTRVEREREKNFDLASLLFHDENTKVAVTLASNSNRARNNDFFPPSEVYSLSFF